MAGHVPLAPLQCRRRTGPVTPRHSLTREEKTKRSGSRLVGVFAFGSVLSAVGSVLRVCVQSSVPGDTSHLCLPFLILIHAM